MTKRLPKLKVHPIANLVPGMSAEAFHTLKDDIEAHGLNEPIWVKGNLIIDGKHRYRACKELKVECPTREFEGDDIESFVISANVARRQLTGQQRAGFVKRLLKLHPEKSNRQIAATIGVSHSTVRAYRRDAEDIGQIVQCSTVTTSDGRTYPTRRTKPAGPSHPASSFVSSIDLEGRRFLKWLYELHPNQLTDPAFFLGELDKQLERIRGLSTTEGVKHA